MECLVSLQYALTLNKYRVQINGAFFLLHVKTFSNNYPLSFTFMHLYFLDQTISKNPFQPKPFYVLSPLQYFDLLFHDKGFSILFYLL